MFSAIYHCFRVARGDLIWCCARITNCVCVRVRPKFLMRSYIIKNDEGCPQRIFVFSITPIFAGALNDWEREAALTHPALTKKNLDNFFFDSFGLRSIIFVFIFHLVFLFSRASKFCVCVWLNGLKCYHRCHIQMASRFIMDFRGIIMKTECGVLWSVLMERCSPTIRSRIRVRWMAFVINFNYFLLPR